jgi:hypothetical protein
MEKPVSCSGKGFTAAHNRGTRHDFPTDTVAAMSLSMYRLRVRRWFVHWVICRRFWKKRWRMPKQKKIDQVIFINARLAPDMFTRARQLRNFYFHVTTTYAILRHNGVDIGKRDYLGSI